MVKIPIGVAYGTNVEKVRDILRENMKELDCWNQKRGLEILFDNFGENSVDLILVCWVPVSKKLMAVSQMKEVVYKTFNDNGIEIPFPQRDVYVRQMTAEKIKSPITEK
jgi:small-conductance mechanosensitive channel